MVQIRHEMATVLGFPSYVELAYAEMERTDYGPPEVAIFREEVQNIWYRFVHKFWKNVVEVGD